MFNIITEMLKVAKALNYWLEMIINSQKEKKYNNDFTDVNNNKIVKNKLFMLA